jgi:hypothetical protein
MVFAAKQKRKAIFAVTVMVMASLTASSISDGAQKETPAEAKKIATDAKTISALIQQLGDESFEKRDLASTRLAAIGAPALSLLEKAAEDGPDLETRTRAVGLIRLIRQATAGDGLAPGYVRHRVAMVRIIVMDLPKFNPVAPEIGRTLKDSGYLRHKAVQDELKLSVEQIAKIDDLHKELRNAIAAFNKDDLDNLVVSLKIDRVMPKWEKAAADLLTPEQLRRFRQIQLQVAAPSAFLDPEVAEALKLTDEQKQSIRHAYNDGRREWMLDSLKTSAKLGGKKREKMMRDYDAAATQKIVQILSEAQKREYANMIGETFGRKDELPWSSHPILKSEPKKK